MLSSKWSNNKASDIKLVYLYSTVKMMHGPINLRISVGIYYAVLKIYMHTDAWKSHGGFEWT